MVGQFFDIMNVDLNNIMSSFSPYKLVSVVYNLVSSLEYWVMYYILLFLIRVYLCFSHGMLYMISFIIIYLLDFSLCKIVLKFFCYQNFSHAQQSRNFYFVLGYVYPDSYFQSVQIMARDVFGVNAIIPWEFKSIGFRSLGFPFLSTGIPYYILKFVIDSLNHFGIAGK